MFKKLEIVFKVEIDGDVLLFLIWFINFLERFVFL